MQEYCIFSACTMSSQRKFTFAISSPDEFLVSYSVVLLCDYRYHHLQLLAPM